MMRGLFRITKIRKAIEISEIRGKRNRRIEAGRNCFADLNPDLVFVAHRSRAAQPDAPDKEEHRHGRGPDNRALQKIAKEDLQAKDQHHPHEGDGGKVVEDAVKDVDQTSHMVVLWWRTAPSWGGSDHALNDIRRVGFECGPSCLHPRRYRIPFATRRPLPLR